MRLSTPLALAAALTLLGCARPVPPPATAHLARHGTVDSLDAQQDVHYAVGDHIDAPPDGVWGLRTVALGKTGAVSAHAIPDRVFELTVSVLEPARRMVWEDGDRMFAGTRTLTLAATDGRTDLPHEGGVHRRQAGEEQPQDAGPGPSLGRLRRRRCRDPGRRAERTVSNPPGVAPGTPADAISVEGHRRAPVPMRFPLFLLITALGLGVACEGDGEGADDASSESENGDKDKAPRTDPRTLVEVKPIVTGSVGDYLVTSGTVEAEAQADLVPELTGTVVALHVEEGDRVRKGQKLATLASPNLEANQARAVAEMARARKDHAEVQRLFDQGVISQRELDESSYRVETAKTTLDEARLMFGHTIITSPIAGTVAVRDIRLGEVAGGRRAFQVVELSRLRVVVKVPEKDLARLAVGMPATLTGAYDEDATVSAQVVRIAPTIDAMSGTVRVTVELDPDQTLLRPGQFVSVRIEVGRHDDVMVMARRSLGWQDGEPIAFRVRIEEPPPEPEPDPDDEPDKDGEDEEEEAPLPGPYRMARQVSLVLGYQDHTLVEVISGLELGDEVVTNGGASLRDEVRVRYAEDPTVGDDGTDEPAAEGTPAGAGADGADASGAEAG